MPDDQRRKEAFTGIRVLMRSTLWNIVGRLAPMIIALFSTPVLLHQLGVERWGVFTLALGLVGMFGVFDFGVGRVLARAVSEHLADGQEDQAVSLVWTGSALVTLFGVLGALVGSLFVPHLVRSVLNMPAGLHRETILAMYVLAVAGPLVVLNGALWGVISAFQKFAAANLVNMPVMMMYYLGPLAVLQFDNSLVAVMAVLVGCRVAMTVAYMSISLKSMPALRRVQFDARAIRQVLTFGSWITLSNILFQLMQYLDRFVIGSLVSISATAYYATPSDLINRFWIVPIAAMDAVFPAMAQGSRGDPAHTATLFRRSTIFISSAVFVGSICAVAIPGPLLDIWLGHDFSQHAAPILRVLGIAIFFDCLAFVPNCLLASIGRFDVNAKLSAGQITVYIPVLFALVYHLGAEGAAFASLGRAMLGFAAASIVAGRLFRPARDAIRKVLPELAGACCLMVLPLLVPDLLARIFVMAIAVLSYFSLVWFFSLTADERHYARVRAFSFVRL